MVRDTKKIGNASEDLAISYLMDKGYEILSRNVRKSFGEIDVICLKNRILVAVEVKTIPENWAESEIGNMVNPYKILKIKRVLGTFIAMKESLVYDEIRFDVISVSHSGIIRHYQGVH